MNETFQFLATHPLGYFAAFILGLIWGSFYNVCIARLPDDKSLLGRSQCPKCQTQIRWHDNIPILSYFLLKFRCRTCKAGISWQYPLVELTTGLLFLLLFMTFGLSWKFLAYTIFCSSLLVITVIDLHHQIIPDEISLPGIVIGLLACFLTKDIPWWSSLLGIAIGGGSFLLIAWLYEKMSGQEGLGGGDVKLLAMIGAWLGHKSILTVVIVSSTVGSLIGICLLVFQRKNLKTAIPFGPFLALGALIYLFWGGLIENLLLQEY